MSLTKAIRALEGQTGFDLGTASRPDAPSAPVAVMPERCVVREVDGAEGAFSLFSEDVSSAMGVLARALHPAASRRPSPGDIGHAQSVLEASASACEFGTRRVLFEPYGRAWLGVAAGKTPRGVPYVRAGFVEPSGRSTAFGVIVSASGGVERGLCDDRVCAPGEPVGGATLVP